MRDAATDLYFQHGHCPRLSTEMSIKPFRSPAMPHKTGAGLFFQDAVSEIQDRRERTAVVLSAAGKESELPRLSHRPMAAAASATVLVKYRAVAHV